MARSFTVPFTASVPMSPPGKKIGRTTKASVVKARRPPPQSSVAWSSSRFSTSLPKAGRKTFRSSSALRRPPPPCPITTRS